MVEGLRCSGRSQSLAFGSLLLPPLSAGTLAGRRGRLAGDVMVMDVRTDHGEPSLAALGRETRLGTGSTPERGLDFRRCRVRGGDVVSELKRGAPSWRSPLPRPRRVPSLAALGRDGRLGSGS